MEKRDIDEVSLLEKEIFSQPWNKNDFEESIKSKNNLYLIVESENEIIGYCGYRGISGEGYIYNVAIKKDYRGKNIGYKLMSNLIDEGKKNGIKEFILEVRQSNIVAIRLYEKLGFKIIGVRKDLYIKPIEDAFIMWL
ncbi:MAG TPA: ribosomal protein S18-alanine N-acetyltransferase [Clostridiales bacterium]|nr:ribosomal protein S18-alanine N-acetyltransferase [Clostridiales bacterium]